MVNPLNRRAVILVAALLVLSLALPLVITGAYPMRVVIQTLIFALLGGSWNIVAGYAGLLSLGHGVFFGLGAYVSTLMYTSWGVSPWIGMIGGGLLVAFFATAVMYPTFRLHGHYFAMASIAIAQLALLAFTSLDSVGAAAGISLPVLGNTWSGLQFGGKIPYYYLFLGLLILVLLLSWYLEHSKLGYYLKSIRDDQMAALSLGVPVNRYKAVAVGISALIASMTGSLYAQYLLFIDPNSVLSLHVSIQMSLIGIVGGLGTVLGPVFGAVVLSLLGEGMRIFLGASGRGIDLVIYGITIVIIALFRPEGLASLLSHIRPRGKDTYATADD